MKSHIWSLAFGLWSLVFEFGAEPALPYQEFQNEKPKAKDLRPKA
jgi:hypothetical protein